MDVIFIVQINTSQCFMIGQQPCWINFSLNDTLVFVSEFHKGKERIRTTQWQWAEDVKEYLEEGVLCRGLDTYSGDWIYIQSQLEKKEHCLFGGFC